MTPWPDDIHALLSAMLDGALSAPDEKRLEELLASDPRLQQELDSLVAMRSSLLKGRRPGRLGKDFAGRVVQLASVRAKMESEQSDAYEFPDWIPNIEPSAISPKADPINTPYRNRMWLPLAAVAASVLIAFSAVQFNRLAKFYNERQIARISTEQNAAPTEESINKAPHSNTLSASKSDQDPLAASELTAQTGPAQAMPNEVKSPVANGRIAQDASANSKTSTAPIVEKQLDSDSTLDKLASESVAIREGQQDNGNFEAKMPDDKGVEAAGNSDTSNKIASNDVSLDQKPSGKAGTKLQSTDLTSPAVPAYALTTVHVSQNEDAAQNQILHRILERHNILSIDDLAMSPEELKGLVASGAAGGVAPDGANVYFLKGYARNLSGAIEDLCHQYKNFPDFGINIIFDDSAMVLVNQLQEINIGQEPAIATRVGIQTDQGFLTGFSAGTASPRAMPVNRRTSQGSNGILASIDTNPISYLLLVVRNAEELSDSPKLESSTQAE